MHYLIALGVAAVIGLCIYSAIADDQACTAKGGHLRSYSAYKSSVSVSFCLSADGRVLE